MDNDYKQILLLGAPSRQPSVSLAHALMGDEKCICAKGSLQSMSTLNLPTSDMDCIVVFVDRAERLDLEVLREFCLRSAPTPVIVVSNETSTIEPELLSNGAEDCINAGVIKPSAFVRLVARCLERAAQRDRVNAVERQFGALFDNMPVPVFQIDSNARIVNVNRAFLKLMDCATADQVSDAQFSGLLMGLAAQLSTAEQGASYKDRHIIEDVKGQPRHVIVSAHSQPKSANQDGALMSVYLSDITDDEIQTRKVIAAESRVRELYNNTPIMMFACDRNGCISDVNTTFVKAMKAEREWLMGRPMAALLKANTEDSDEACAVDVGSIVAAREVPMRLVTSDESTIEVLYTADVISDDVGTIVGLNAILIDVTDRNQAERERDQLHGQLQLAQKLESIGELAAGIAHEINTPAQYVSDNLSFLTDSFDDLTVILNEFESLTAEISKLDNGEPLAQAFKAKCEVADIDYLLEEIPQALTQGKDGIEKIREIVLALKDFSHPGSGTKEAADLNRIIESTVTVARNEWKYVADVKYELEADLPAVDCFPSALAQVVLNIVVNAAHAIGDNRPEHSDAMGNIIISTKMLGEDQIELKIIDDGPGMPESVHQKIFVPFFTTKEVGRGTGQGLAISHSVITEQHGGTIVADTEVGKGTTFTITLPIHSSASANREEVAA